MMKMNKETCTIGVILTVVVFFTLGVNLGVNLQVQSKSDTWINFLAMLGSWISGIGALVAINATLKIAERQNEISFLKERKSIYDAFIDLQQHMLQKRRWAQKKQVINFYKPSSDAAFYFSESLYRNIKEYYDHCFKVSDLAQLRSALNPEEEAQIESSLKAADMLAKKIEEKILEAVKKSALPK